MVDAPLTSVAAGAQSEQPRSPSLTERRMERTRRQLAEMAARLFLERGYEAVTVEEIVTAVEVSPRTFFRYFPSKEDVLDEILVNEAQAITAALRARPKEEPVLDAVKAAAASWLGTAQRDPRTLRLFALVVRTPVLRSRWLLRRHGTQEQLAEILTQRLPVGTEPKMALLAAGALIAVVTTIFEFWVDDLDDAETFTLMDRALEAVVDGFGWGGHDRDLGCGDVRTVGGASVVEADAAWSS